MKLRRLVVPCVFSLLALAGACTGSDPDSPDDETSTPAGGTSTSSGTSGQKGSSSGTSSGTVDATPAPAQFTLAIDPKTIILPKKGGPIGVSLTVTRRPGFDGKIAIDVTGLPPAVTAAALPIDGTAGILDLQTNGAASGVSTVTVVAKAIGGASGDTASASLDILVGDDPGKRDVTFGGGEVTFQGAAGANFAPAGLVVQHDGKIVIAGTQGSGSGQHFQLVRFNSDGSLDPTFGTAGATALDDLALGHASSVALQPTKGGFVVAGETFVGTPIGKAIRFDANGAADLTFGTSGSATISLTDEITNRAVTSHGLQVLPDDSFLWLVSHNSDVTEHDTADLAHFSAAGAIDPGWAGDDNVSAFDCLVGGLIGGTVLGSAVTLANGTILTTGTCGGSEDVNQSVTLFQSFDDAGAPLAQSGDNLRFDTLHGIAQTIRAVGSSNTMSVGDIEVAPQVSSVLVVDLSQGGTQVQKLVIKTSDTDQAHGIAGLTSGGYVVLASGSPALADGGFGNGSTRQSRVLRLVDRGTQDLDWGPGTPQKGVVEVFAEGTEAVAIAVATDQRIIVLGSAIDAQTGKTKAVLRRLWP